MDNFYTPARKRFFIAIPLGVMLGFVCVWFASFSTPDIWGTPYMWTIVADRFLVGMVVGLSGVYMHHPIFGFRLPAAIRGCMLGFATSLPLATSGLISPVSSASPGTIFFVTLITGVIYGLIIDLVATKWGGEGEKLLR